MVRGLAGGLPGVSPQWAHKEYNWITQSAELLANSSKRSGLARIQITSCFGLHQKMGYVTVLVTIIDNFIKPIQRICVRSLAGCAASIVLESLQNPDWTGNVKKCALLPCWLTYTWQVTSARDSVGSAFLDSEVRLWVSARSNRCVNWGRAMRKKHFKSWEVQQHIFAEPCLRRITQPSLTMLNKFSLY